MLLKLSGHGGYVSCCPFLNKDDNHILTGCGDGIVRLWNVKTGDRISELREHTKDITDISVLDRNIFAASSYDGNCSIWDLRTSKLIYRYIGNNQDILSVAFHPSGNSLAIGNEIGDVSIYEMRAMAEITKFSMVDEEKELNEEKTDESDGNTLNTISPEIRSLSFSKSGRLIYASFKDKVVEWDTLKNECISKIHHSNVVSSCAISPDGKALATACWDNMVRIWTPNKK